MWNKLTLRIPLFSFHGCLHVFITRTSHVSNQHQCGVKVLASVSSCCSYCDLWEHLIGVTIYSEIQPMNMLWCWFSLSLWWKQDGSECVRDIAQGSHVSIWNGMRFPPKMLNTMSSRQSATRIPSAMRRTELILLRRRIKETCCLWAMASGTVTATDTLSLRMITTRSSWI